MIRVKSRSSLKFVKNTARRNKQLYLEQIPVQHTRQDFVNDNNVDTDAVEAKMTILPHALVAR